MLKKERKPSILVTGASGFIGKHLIDTVKDSFDVIALARRSSTEAGVPFHPNIRWIQWNIANKISFNEVMGYLIGRGGADIVVHLAGYYDYEYDDNPEYERTNIRGTKNVLELARQLDVEHFIFASSLAACKFPRSDKKVDESTEPDADFVYAKSKKAGEELCLEYSQLFKCSVVRFAAVFSDWCEYGPLYQFIQTWVSEKWDSNILGGKGDSAITYIHINDLVHLLIMLIEKTDELDSYGVYLGSPDGATTHTDLYRIVTRDYFGKAGKPLYIPKLLTYPGLVMKKLLGKFRLVSDPFEKFWMLKYVDQKLSVDASKTRKTTGWEPTPRYQILRRMIFLLDKMKSHPNEWQLKNEAATKRKTFRPNLLIYEFLIDHEEELMMKIRNSIFDESRSNVMKHYQNMDPKEFRIAQSMLYNLLLGSIRSADRILMQHYIRDIALKRFSQNFKVHEVTTALKIFQDVIMNYALEHINNKNLNQDIYDYVGLTMQLAIDEVEEVFYNQTKQLISPVKRRISKKAEKKREEEIRQLSTFYQEYKEDSN